MDLVSVITPSFNSDKFIKQTIESVLSQTYSNWELIIVDDHSIDNSVELINNLIKNDNRIKFVQFDQNQGAARARNKGLELAKGRYIAFCDSDDQWKPNKLESQVRFMLKNNLALSYTSYDVIDEQGNSIGLVSAPAKVNYKIMLQNNYIGCLTAMYDTEKLNKVYMPEIRKRQDWALWLKILKKTDYALAINESLSIYRDRSKSISSNKIEMLKYTWMIYHDIEGFSKLKSTYLILQFLYYYFQKKKA